MEISRRSVLLGTVASAALATSRGAAALVPPDDGAANDPFRWMESGTDPRWLPFLRQEDRAARALLAQVPDRQRIASAVATATASGTRYTWMTVAGARTFLFQVPAGAERGRLVVREPDGSERTLYDASSGRSTVEWSVPSPDGSLVACAIGEGGAENASIFLIDTSTGALRPLHIPRASNANLSWLPDGSGFLYSQTGREGGLPTESDWFHNSVVRLYRLEAAGRGEAVFGHGFDPAIPVERIEFADVTITPGSDWVVATLVRGVSPVRRIYITPLAELLVGLPRWRPVASIAEGVTDWALRRDALYLLVRSGSRREVVQLSLPDTDFTHAMVAVPAAGALINSMAAARDGLYLFDNDAGMGALRRLDDRGEIVPIALPIRGTLLGATIKPDRDGAIVMIQNCVTAPKLLAVDPAGGVTDYPGWPGPGYDQSPYRLERHFATVRDGTRVPVTICWKEGTRRDGSAPAIVNGYGAYGSVNDPYYIPHYVAWLDLGGIYAIAHVRGGGEYGEPWHVAGMKHNKPNGWRDLIDCCEMLVAERWTSPRRLVITGKSAGGIVGGNAMLERPDLMAAAVLRVPTCNPMRNAQKPGGPSNFPEFGDPAVPEEWQGLVRMDPYNRIDPTGCYPPVLLTAGLVDVRVPAWQPAKFAARLKQTASKGPILLRVEFEAGHGMGSAKSQLDGEFTDIFAFALMQTGTRARP